MQFLAVLAGVLASSPLVASSPSEDREDAEDRRIGRDAGLEERDGESIQLQKALAGAACGPTAGNAACDAGLCCSEGVSTTGRTTA